MAGLLIVDLFQSDSQFLQVAYKNSIVEKEISKYYDAVLVWSRFNNILEAKHLTDKIKEEILRKKEMLKEQAEKEILSRLNALRNYLRTPSRDPHISLEEIFRQRKKRNIKKLIAPLMSYFHNGKRNQEKSTKLENA